MVEKVLNMRLIQCVFLKILTLFIVFGKFRKSKPKVAFHTNLMEFMRVVFINCQVSLKSLVDVLNLLRHDLSPKLVCMWPNIVV